MSNLFTDLEKTRAEQRKIVASKDTENKRKSTQKVTRKATRPRDLSRDMSRGKSREKPREMVRDHPREVSHDLPTRDEIQEFTFQMRDELKVKVQAEVPHQWQAEFEDIARQLNVKKLELYRFILGEFLGKVQRKKPE
jgi:hypothetical protein